ncbi:receptor-type tyrosine-protein phosphatase epsilon-like [Liolophura sinensis]|uniref:receptor-type tyrosine-protein phosphatase epsilon-like n=1 Tax=Liolophura sinensis TaxID=3198878 RepID=UPI00315990D6
MLIKITFIEISLLFNCYMTSACPDNKYGVDCSKDCGHCWNNAVCLRENGSCPTVGKHRCQPGYYKQRCVKECTPGKWGADCSADCGHCAGGVACSIQTGECPRAACEEGWQGTLCDVDKSKICPDKMFGENCEHKCGMCYGGKECNKTTGHCPVSVPLCQPGATGPQCRTNCSRGFYGADCKETCGKCYKDLTCEPVTGICPNQGRNMRCQPGWAGNMCRTRCSKGRYGVDCKSVCSAHCVVKGECNLLTGACVVSPTQVRCEPGWTGDDCQTGCSQGKYGADCSLNCGNCHMGSCDAINGTCYKSDTSPRCLVGFRGLQCQTPCKNGTYGPDCQHECHCKGGNPCEQSGSCPVEKNGLRLCEPGWIGPKCNTACSANRYGEGCRSECGHCHDMAECNIHTGACPQLLPNTAVCQEGWTGDRCDTEEKSAADNTVLLVCVCIACTVLLAALAIFLIFYLRRRTLAKRRQANGDDPQQLFNLLGPDERNGVPKSELKSNRRRLLLGKHSDEGGKVTPLITTTSVQISNLLNFINSQGFKKEHELLPKGLTASTTEASKPENKAKNRFQGIVAYDHSRVVLNLKDGVPCSDYINACFVHGYNEQFRYIASQGPTCLMMDDFWRMVWQFDCTRIIMLTNLVEDARRKCDLYWPTSGNKKFGDVSVTLLETEAYADFTIRTFNVSNELDLSVPSRIVKQFHFTSWPDHGVPHYPTALVHFREKVHTTNTTGTGPLVVHCSAGIGRTGTFIGLDYLIDQAKVEDKVDVLHCVLSMRKQRVNMIQTEEQYAFLYEALAEAVLLSNMSMEASKFEEKYRELQIEDSDSGKTGLLEQFEMLASLSPTVTEKDCVSACLPENLHRNRDPSVLAVDHWRPFLSTQWTDTTDYINAVFLPAYRDNCAFIATQMPLPHTTVDMWRLVHGQKSQCLLMLNDLEALEDEKCVYWPYDDTTEGMFGPYKVQVIEVEKKTLYDIQTMTVTYTPMPDKVPFTVKQFVVKFWPEGRDVPSNPGDLVTLIEEVDRWRQQSGQGPVIVHCMNGADKCGLYCAVSGILERLKTDQEVNILQTVKQMRINRPQVIKNLAQYQACFDSVVAFLESFQTYSNFK